MEEHGVITTRNLIERNELMKCDALKGMQPGEEAIYAEEDRLFDAEINANIRARKDSLRAQRRGESLDGQIAID